MSDEIQTEKHDRTGYISYGDAVSINCSIYDNVPNIGPLIVQSRDAIQVLRKESIAKEDKIFDEIGAIIQKWYDQAAITRSFNRALEYLSTPEVSHTYNKWVKLDHSQGEKISNRVFSMRCRILDTTRYDHKKNTRIPVYYASWDLYLNTPRHGYGRQVAGQADKRFTDRASAEKYLEGRKKAYSAYFIEISPPIPMQYRESFMVHGHLLPGYIVEGMEPKRVETEKPSVLGKLNEAKTSDKSADAAVPEKQNGVKKKQEAEI